MKPTALIAAFAALTLTLPGAASAQLAPGTSGFTTAPIEGSEKDFWWLLHELGRCTANLKFEEAQAFLSTEIDSPAESRAFDDLFGGKRNVCMRTFVSMAAPRAYIRGALAEGMYEKMNAAGAAPVVAALGDEAVVSDLHDFARCHLVSHAGRAHALLAGTRLGTDDERKAVRTMASEFGPCLPQGAEVKINAPELRMALAEALYHAAAGTSSNGTDE